MFLCVSFSRTTGTWDRKRREAHANDKSQVCHWVPLLGASATAKSIEQLAVSIVHYFCFVSLLCVSMSKFVYETERKKWMNKVGNEINGTNESASKDDAEQKVIVQLNWNICSYIDSQKQVFWFK